MDGKDVAQEARNFEQLGPREVRGALGTPGAGCGGWVRQVLCDSRARAHPHFRTHRTCRTPHLAQLSHLSSHLPSRPKLASTVDGRAGTS